MPHTYDPGCTSSCRPKWGVCSGGPISTAAILHGAIDPALVSWLYDYSNDPTAYDWGGDALQSEHGEELLEYMNYMEGVAENLPRVLYVYGSGQEVINFDALG